MRLKKAGSMVCKAVMIFMAVGIVLLGNAEAETYKFVFKIPSSQQWYFDFPRGIAVDSSGDVYVADTGNDCIQKFDSSGGFIVQWGSPGSGDGQFFLPQGVAVDSSGNVYAVDRENNRIQKFKLLGLNNVDFDGDGRTDIAVYRASTGYWYIKPSAGAPAYGVGWGGGWL